MKKPNKNFVDWIKWLHGNCIVLGMNQPEHSAFPFFNSVDKISNDDFTLENVEVLIMWTHPRFETGAGMTIPVDIDNTGGWGAIRRVNEIHEYALQYKRENFSS